MPQLHIPANSTAMPMAAPMNTSDTRNAVLALIAESLQGIDESMYVIREYVKKKGLSEGIFTVKDLDFFDGEEEPEEKKV